MRRPLHPPVEAHLTIHAAATAAELAGHVQAVTFDAGTGRLDVAPDAPAYGTKMRWSAPTLIAAANERVQGTNAPTLYVLPPVSALTRGCVLDERCAAPRLRPNWMVR